MAMNNTFGPHRRRDHPWRRFCRNKLNVISLVFVLAVVLATIVGPSLLPFRYDETDIELGLSPPSWRAGHPLGTDILGRDLLARLLYGGRLSLLVALVATTISLGIGVC
ncbi:MAG TPA: hypothetical protein VNM72_13575, partial [Blastocatellia bacterium]|nr:hypothetical protein [Blastocatellia bacterium]